MAKTKTAKKKLGHMSEYAFDIYPCTIWVITEDLFQSVADQFEVYASIDDMRDRGQTYPMCKESAAFAGKVGLVRHKASDRIGLLVSFVKSHTQLHIIAHESVHIADAIFELIGASPQSFSESNEPYAYLLDYIYSCIMYHFANYTNIKLNINDYKYSKEPAKRRQKA